MEPRVTFIIAHHNYQQYLGKAITSALNQTHQNTHICIIDDCSTDQESVKKIVDGFVETWNNIDITQSNIYNSDKITYIELKKHIGYGPSHARNVGIKYCWDNTDIFAMLDADDENLPEKIEKSVEIINQDPANIGVVYPDSYILNVETGRIVHEFRQPFDYFKLIQECIVHSGSVITKHALNEVLENGMVYDEKMRTCEDYDLWLRIAEKFLIMHLPEPMILFRVHKENSTSTTTHASRMNDLKYMHNKRIQRNG